MIMEVTKTTKSGYQRRHTYSYVPFDDTPTLLWLKANPAILERAKNLKGFEAYLVIALPKEAKKKVSENGTLLIAPEKVMKALKDVFTDLVYEDFVLKDKVEIKGISINDDPWVFKLSCPFCKTKAEHVVAAVNLYNYQCPKCKAVMRIENEEDIKEAIMEYYNVLSPDEVKIVSKDEVMVKEHRVKILLVEKAKTIYDVNWYALWFK